MLYIILLYVYCLFFCLATFSECSVGLKPYNEWKHGRRKEDLINDLHADLNKLPGYQVSFSQPIFDMVMDQIAGSHADLAIKIYGEDLAEARRLVEKVQAVVKSIKGAEDVSIEQEPPLPQLQIHANRDKIALYGLNVSDVAELIEVAIGGKAISQVFVGNKSYDVTCRYNDASRETPEKIGSLMLTSASGAKIPLSQIAEISTTTGAGLIARESNKRFINVKVNLRDCDITTFLHQANNAIVPYNHDEFHIKWSGQFDNQKRAYAKLC